METVWNLSDTGIQGLPKQRLFLLMNQTGMAYVATGDDVGTYENQVQSERTGNRKHLKKLAKTSVSISIAMGLEPVGVMGQQRSETEQVPTTSLSWWMFFLVFSCCDIGCCSRSGNVETLEKLTRHIRSAELPLADHYEYATGLCQRLDDIDRMLNPEHAVQ